MFGDMYQKVFAKMFTVSKAGVCKMCEQVSKGVQLWMCLLQLGVSLVSGEDHRTNRPREQRVGQLVLAYHLRAISEDLIKRRKPRMDHIARDARK